MLVNISVLVDLLMLSVTFSYSFVFAAVAGHTGLTVYRLTNPQKANPSRYTGIPNSFLV